MMTEKTEYEGEDRGEKMKTRKTNGEEGRKSGGEDKRGRKGGKWEEVEEEKEDKMKTRKTNGRRMKK